MGWWRGAHFLTCKKGSTAERGIFAGDSPMARMWRERAQGRVLNPDADGPDGPIDQSGAKESSRELHFWRARPLFANYKFRE